MVYFFSIPLHFSEHETSVPFLLISLGFPYPFAISRKNKNKFRRHSVMGLMTPRIKTTTETMGDLPKSFDLIIEN